MNYPPEIYLVFINFSFRGTFLVSPYGIFYLQFSLFHEHVPLSELTNIGEYFGFLVPKSVTSWLGQTRVLAYDRYNANIYTSWEGRNLLGEKKIGSVRFSITPMPDIKTKFQLSVIGDIFQFKWNFLSRCDLNNWCIILLITLRRGVHLVVNENVMSIWDSVDAILTFDFPRLKETILLGQPQGALQNFRN